MKWPYQLGSLGLGITVPLGVHLIQLLSGRQLRVASMVASTAALVGGYTQRVVLIFAGRRSAERPLDYLGVTGDVLR